ncbi:hypothetical protein YC2023_017799 [Brassica napus]|uniref:(rape) hypothetical protein n=1 Tax=Brassica napus TaxID=3708 RepID=A0A816K8A8_BRANA|nr:unnamed protein product [Brassica napus]
MAQLALAVAVDPLRRRRRRNTWLMGCCNHKVLAEEGKAKAIAFDEIDKAPGEKKREITIATACFMSSSYYVMIV